MKFAFIARHQPTPEQLQLAQQQDIELVTVGDRDAFTIDPAEFTEFAGVVVVHPAAALRCIATVDRVGIFENANRAAEGQPPQFAARKLHLFSATTTSDKDCDCSCGACVAIGHKHENYVEYCTPAGVREGLASE